MVVLIHAHRELTPVMTSFVESLAWYVRLMMMLVSNPLSFMHVMAKGSAHLNPLAALTAAKTPAKV